jgi:uncharacterized protein YrrD
MKTLMLTTALVTITAFGAAAQTATETDGETTAAMTEATGSQGMVPAFLSSNFTGKSLYTVDTEAARELSGQDDAMANADGDQARWSSSETFLADRDSWESVGSINDVVMTQDGEIRGVLVDVGGFLGIMARTVMVEVDSLYFVTEEGAPEAIDDFSVVIAMSQEEIEALPEWDETLLRAGYEMQAGDEGDAAMSEPAETATASGATDATQDDTTAVIGDDYVLLEGEERTADRLIGADVYDATGENIGAVEDVLIAGDNSISEVLVDVGGFLGIGAHTVALPVEDAQIGWRDADGDVRVQVSMPAEALEALPEHDS